MTGIDKRVVEMQFNNKQFEDNVGTSIKSLDNLKKGLNLDGAVKSLSNLDRAGKSFSLEGIANGVDAIANKFSTLGIIGITALQNITNSAINMAKNIVSAFTIDPIKTGLSEYEIKMNAIQTILTNTASKGSTLEDVNKALNELNTYSDKTIYNFAEMARNIGTFTAAGVDLKTSTTSIKGIANLAAGSGSSALQASTAMYQLSQAIAAGSVKLMDWNSVVNAGMGGELFQTALKKTAKEMGVVVDTSIPFRESLEKGWVTTEVLTKTLAKFAEDESLIKAATQVKTFTQLVDTMKESVQSGWAQTWENIIGNKDEAASFFTTINDYFGSIAGASATARNNVLAFWKANGGRQAVLESISNVVNGLASVLKPIGDAFSQIFPATTGKQLVTLSEKIRDLTANFKIGAETAKNLKNTFAGFFAFLDIGKQALMAISNGLFSVAKTFLPISGSFLSFTGSIGQFIVALDNAIKSSNIFNVSMENVGKILQPIAYVVKKTADIISKAFSSFGNIEMSGLNRFSEQLELKIDPFKKLQTIIEGVFSVFIKLASLIDGVFTKLADSIMKSFNSSNFNSIFDIINSSLFAAILYGIKKFIGSLTSITDGVGGFLGNITGILDGVKGCLVSYQSSLKAGILLKIAVSIAILSAALIALAGIDSGKLTLALTAMTAMFIELFGAMAIFERTMGLGGFLAMMKITTGMIGLSVAVLILSAAMTKLAKLDWNGLAKGLTGIAALAGILVVTSKLLETGSKSLIRSSVGFIVFGTAILILASAVKKLGALDLGDLTKGLVGVGVLMAELVLFMKAIDLSGMGMIKGLGLLVLAGAIVVLATAVKKISEIDVGALVKGLIGVGVILTELTLFVNFTGDAKRVISTATGLVILGAAIYILAEAITKMGSMTWGETSRGLLTLGGALAMIVVMLNTLPTKNTFLNSLALIDIASAILMLARALEKMGAMSWAAVAKSLIAMGGALGIIVATFAVLKNGIIDGTALMIMASAIFVLAKSLAILGSMSLAEVGVALLALAGTFVVIGAAGLLLAPIVPGILALGAAIVLLGIGVAAIGGGILALSAGLTALALAGTAGTVALVAMVSGLIGLIPYFIQTIAQGIVNFAKVIGEGAPVIANAFKAIVLSIIDVLVTITPVVTKAFGVLLTNILETSLEYIPHMIDVGMRLILGFLKGLADHIEEVTKTAIDVTVNFIEGVAKQMPKIVQAGFDLMVGFINGLADAIRNNAGPVLDAVENLLFAIIEAGGTILKKIGKSFIKIGENIVQGLIDGMKSKIPDVTPPIVKMAADVILAAKKKFDTHSPSLVFENIGKNLGAGLANGIGISSKDAENASGNMSTKVVKASTDAAKKAFDAAVEWINDRKYYNELSLKEELIVWQGLQQKYIAGTEERKKADKEVYRVKQELNKAGYEDSIKWIDNEKYYNRSSLNEELAAWERVQKKYLENSTEREKADKEVYRVKQELIKADEEYSQKVIDIAKATNEKKIQLEQDYYAKAQEINDKLISDIQSVNDKYDQALESRTQSLYSTYGLFDKVETPTDVSGTDLISNLQGQVDEFRTWQSQLDALSGKGISADLISELQQMGPKSLSQIKALNQLSQPELDNYVSLWQTKSQQARSQAREELQGLRADCNNEIDQINIDAQIKLEENRVTWETAMTALSTDTVTQLTNLKKDWLKKIGELKTESEKKFSELTTNIVDIMKKPDWIGVGSNIVNGMSSGVMSKASELADASVEVALRALEAVNEALGINSPSKEFAKVGMGCMEGMVKGIKTLSGTVVSASSNVGTTLVSTIKDAVSNVSDLLNGNIDMTPVIRPVLDLSDVETGGQLISAMFSKIQGLDVSLLTSKLPSITKITATADKNDIPDTKPEPKTPISFVQNNYSPTALSRLDIYRQTKNQLSTMKGLISNA